MEKEDISKSVESTSHPVEEGLPLTDTTKLNQTTLSISGKIVNVEGMSADDALDKIIAIQKNRTLANYVGRNNCNKMLITSFSYSSPNTNNGGRDFNMELKEVRIPKKAYVASSGGGGQTAIGVGSIVVFKGGSVYVSSDAKNAAANRGRSTCKVTAINTRSWGVHSYHLVSTDGAMVYGWVDASNIEFTGSAVTAGTSNAGTQQPKKAKTTKTEDPYVYISTGTGGLTYNEALATAQKNGLTAKEFQELNAPAYGDISNHFSNMRTGELESGMRLIVGKK